MREVDKYKESDLGGSGITIRDYQRVERDGAIIIKYVHVDHAAGAAQGAAYGVTAFFLLGPLIGAAIGAAAGYSTNKCYYFDARTGELIGETQNEASEKLNQKGCQLFQEGNYTEARIYHDNANRICSSDYHNAQKFRNDRDKADAEIRAKNLNNQGDNLFNQGNYKEAHIKYREAYSVSQVSNQYNKYAANRDKAEAEARAKDLNDQGDNLFKQGNYKEAQIKYRDAYDASKVSNEYNKYAANRQKALAEILAGDLNDQGDNLFKQGNYKEAQIKYRKACDVSQVSNQCSKYASNKDKAGAEIRARDLNDQGDNLFKEGNYKEAQTKYQEAFGITCVENERHIYARRIDRAETIINILSKLDTLWNEAWIAENDTDNNRSGEAKEIFQRLLSESKGNLKTFPDNLRLKQYETLASLKIDGNELFNQGLELQQNAVQILKEAQELKHQQKCKSAIANLKFKEAKDKFIAAEERFEKGSKYDQRFLSCIDFVKNQLKEVMISMQITEKQMLSKQLCDLDINISNGDRSDADFSEPDITGQQGNYYEQI